MSAGCPNDLASSESADADTSSGISPSVVVRFHRLCDDALDRAGLKLFDLRAAHAVPRKRPAGSTSEICMIRSAPT